MVLRVLGTSEIYCSSDCVVTSHSSVSVKVRDVENDTTSLVNVTNDGIITKYEGDETTLLNTGKDGFTMTRKGSGLKGTLVNILTELINFQTVSPGGNGVTAPPTVVNLNKYKTELDNYLEA